jgi:hypothetical protein
LIVCFGGCAFCQLAVGFGRILSTKSVDNFVDNSQSIRRMPATDLVLSELPAFRATILTYSDELSAMLFKAARLGFSELLAPSRAANID